VVLGYSFWSRLLALLREEFRISKLTFHSDLRRWAASRLALPCPSSFLSIIITVVTVFMLSACVYCDCVVLLRHENHNDHDDYDSDDDDILLCSNYQLLSIIINGLFITYCLFTWTVIS